MRSNYGIKGFERKPERSTPPSMPILQVLSPLVSHSVEVQGYTTFKDHYMQALSCL